LSHQFQEAYANISDIGNNLLRYLREFRQARALEGDDTCSLQSVDNEILTSLDALKNQKYEVAVVAPMKAGKSTFLNAVIGADILASEAAACTVCRTDIKHIQAGRTPRLLEYKQGDRHPSVLVEGGAITIQQKFLERTREIRDGNQEIPARFELEHPIEAIANLPALSGFTLIDTPGPNEWKSKSTEASAIKQASLEALRTCKAVLFILNYSSFKDNAVNELFESITENRQELLEASKGRIYFILNQVDRKSEKDPEISETIEFLKQELIDFNFPDPMVYPVSALQGLLAKLIQQDKASDKQIKDFKDFFSARYRTENEDGDSFIPAPRKIASQAIEDSGIMTIQDAVFQTIVQNAGWNLLSDVLNKLDAQAKAIETSLNTQIVGWQMEVKTLREKVEEYTKKRASARIKVDKVKVAVNDQKVILMDRFGHDIDNFADTAKEKIQEQIDLIIENRSSENDKRKYEIDLTSTENNSTLFDSFPRMLVKAGEFVLEQIHIAGKPLPLSLLFKVSVSLLERMNGDRLIPSSSEKVPEPYLIEISNDDEAKKISETINGYCASYIQTWWLTVQDRLIFEGTKVREELVKKIQDDIQSISDELSLYLGESLQAKLNVSPIQFPHFEFAGIDEAIIIQQEVVTRATEKVQHQKSRCCDTDETYYVDLEVKKAGTVNVVDLRATAEQIKEKIDEQVQRNISLLGRVIQKQVYDDFTSADKQISAYMNKFQVELEKILVERDRKQFDSPVMIELLTRYRIKLEEHLQSLNDSRVELNAWQSS
jgi:GTPase Era involved in 16S rRNA processing